MILTNNHEQNQIQIKQEFGQSSSQNIFQPNVVSLPGDQSSKLCAVCNDRASGKHYGVYSCEGCKGFFKRTVRKNLNYSCRDDRNCTIDKRQRNRCQFCRYQKCVSAGMKKEAVQDERLKRPPNEEEFANPLDEMPVMDILEAEKEYNNNQQTFPYRHVNWAARIPHFKKLGFHDQKILIRTAYTELFILNLAFQRTASKYQEQRERLERYLNSDVMDKIQEIQLDDTEIGSLKAIILLNPDSRGLHYPEQVLAIREKLYASLEAYCKTTFPDRKGRFARILLRLPALRSIGLEAEIEAAVDWSPIESISDSYLQGILSQSDPLPVKTESDVEESSEHHNDLPFESNSYLINSLHKPQANNPPLTQNLPPHSVSSSSGALGVVSSVRNGGSQGLEPLLPNNYQSVPSSIRTTQLFSNSPLLNHESFLK